MATLTITFRGLCLFARKDMTRLHVFLAQPEGMPHRSIRRYREADGSWTAEKIPQWNTLDFGRVGDPITALPLPTEMTNISLIRGNDKLPETEARQGQSTPPTWLPHDHRGSHVILNGGALSVKDVIGVWGPEANPASATYYFPYKLEWQGYAPVATELQIWNTVPNEAPTLGKNSRERTSTLSPTQAAAMAAEHFKAYFRILAGDDGVPLVMKGTIPPLDDLKKKGKKGILSLIVSSCPSGDSTLT